MNIGTKPDKDGVEGRILTSTAALFADFGYNSISTRYIATRAGVNEVTIYRQNAIFMWQSSMRSFSRTSWEATSWPGLPKRAMPKP